METPQAIDQKLVAAAAAGDAAAWDELIRRYQGFILSLALRYGLSHADADDLFQDVCLKLYRHLGELRDARRLSSWLAAIVRQEIWARGRQRKTTFLEDLPEGERLAVEIGPAGGGMSGPEEEILRLEREHLVRLSLEALGEECRRLLTLLYGPDEASYAETAERLGMPLGSVGPRRARCLARLKKILEEFGH